MAAIREPAAAVDRVNLRLPWHLTLTPMLLRPATVDHPRTIQYAATATTLTPRALSLPRRQQRPSVPTIP